MTVHDPHGLAARIVTLKSHVALIDRVLTKRSRYVANMAARQHIRTLTSAEIGKISTLGPGERLSMFGIHGVYSTNPEATLLSWRDAAVDRIAEARA